MLNRSASLVMSTSILKALPGKLDIKRHSPSILYLLQSQTETDVSKTDASETAAKENDDKVKSDADVIKTFKQFMEQSSLGEFNTRLDMLLSFHCQMVSMETSSKLGQ